MGFFKRLFHPQGGDPSQSPSTSSSSSPSTTTTTSTPTPSDQMATQGAPSFLAPALNSQSTPSTSSTSTDSPSSTSTSTPAFDSNQVTVIFVLGGPGAGKGTQCARLVEEHQFVHLSAGDLLRAEQTRTGSEYGEMIKSYIKEGKIVPMEVTIKLLENAMRDKMEGSNSSSSQGQGRGGRRFLIDGFPRQMDQAVKFDESVCKSSLVLFLVCPEPILLERLLERGKTSGRDDDNEESIKKRFQTFINTSMPVVDYYRKQGKVVDIDSSKPIETVYEEIVQGIKPVLSST